MTKIQIIIGTTRPNRFSEKPAHWIFNEAKKRTDIKVELVDLRDYPLPYYDEALSPAALQGKYEKTEVKKWAEKISEADGYIIVTGEYNHGYPAVLKNALDYIYYPWNKKAVGFVSYGSVNGARSVEQLRQVVIELQMAPIRSSIYLPSQVYMAVKSQKPDDKLSPFESLSEVKDSFLDQLIWWTKALKQAREKEEK
ncbi:NAD(P)H-dependent oxidoreductase [Candidatus Daviesbacteria bacterium]|nr:NAD(P)H-dependent oxidoreductase [Candidatus Daviesbacteria bacterium]